MEWAASALRTERNCSYENIIVPRQTGQGLKTGGQTCRILSSSISLALGLGSNGTVESRQPRTVPCRVIEFRKMGSDNHFVVHLVIWM